MIWVVTSNYTIWPS